MPEHVPSSILILKDFLSGLILASLRLALDKAETRGQKLMKRMRTLLGAAFAVLASALLIGPAKAAPVSSLSAHWYTIAFGHPDVEKSVNGFSPGLVETSLGPNGLPVRSALSAGASPTSSNHITNVDPVTSEILWWAPQAGLVSVDPFYTNSVAIPFDQPSNLFPSGLSSNGNPNGYISTHFFGTFDTPDGGAITLTFGADDDAWIFINGQLVVDNGGVKELFTAPTVINNLAVGKNRIDLFFADRHTVQSGLVFNADVTFTPVPEPSTATLFGVSLLGLMIARRRRMA